MFYLFNDALTSMVEYLLMVRMVINSILCGGPLNYFLFQPVLHNWYINGHDMCYHVCGIVLLKDPLLIGNNSPFSVGTGLPGLPSV